jgi:hypothetical protein
MDLLGVTIDSRTSVPVTGELPGQGAVVLLGGNSRGKTTVLECLATHLGQHTGELREWPSFRPRPDAHLEARFSIGETDRQNLETLLDALRSDKVVRDSAYRRGGPRLLMGPDPEVASLSLDTILDSGLLSIELGAEAKVHAGSDRAYLGWVDPYELSTVAAAIAVGTDVPDPSTLLETVVEDVLESWVGFGYAGIPDAARQQGRADRPPADPWLETRETEHHVYVGIVALLNAVEELLNRWVPRFVTEAGQLRCRLLPLESWLLAGGHVEVVLETERVDLPAHAMGSGSRRWVAVALSLIRDALLGEHVGEVIAEPHGYDGGLLWVHQLDLDQLPTRRSTILLDEPEAHLHPVAQRDVAGWIAERAADGYSVIAATHSPALLDLPLELASYHVLRRDPESITIAQISDDVLGALDDQFAETGFGRDAWFALVRAVLIVEGEHDLRIVQRFFGRELRAARVPVLAMRGGRNWRAIVDSEFLGAAAIPVYVLFDNVRLPLVQQAAEARGLDRDEEKWAWQLLQQQRSGQQIAVLPYDEPDILCALPPAAVLRRVPDRTEQLTEALDGQLSRWAPLIDRYRQDGIKRSFKDWVFADVLGLRAPGAQLVSECIEQLTDADTPSPALHRAISTLLASD